MVPGTVHDDLIRQLRVAPRARVRLSDRKAARTFDRDEEEAERALKSNRKRLEQLQYKMYADGRFGMLVVFQAIDAGGKDGTIRHVISAFNPQGCCVTSFKAPSTEELRHDYLWRIHQHAPRRGGIAVFNRSHYEDVLVARVNQLAPVSVIERRYGQINDFERMLADNGIQVVKFFLHIGKAEQKRRFQARLDKPHKQWKFDPQDLQKRRQWKAYQLAFQSMLNRCSTAQAPWYVIPAEHKWFRNLAVSQILLHHLQHLPLRFPSLTYDPADIRLT